MANVPGLYKVTQAGVVTQLSIPLALWCEDGDANVGGFPISPSAYYGDWYRLAWDSVNQWWDLVSPPPDPLAGYTTGSPYYMVGIGYTVLPSSRTATYAVHIGYRSGYYAGNGALRNVGIGGYAGYYMTGADNVCIGYYAGASPTGSGAGNVLLGANTALNSTSTANAIVIGKDVTAKWSNTTTIGNTSINDAWIRGYTLHVGKETAQNIMISFQIAGSGNVPGIRWDNTAGEVQFSNDGSIWTALGGGGGGLTGVTNDVSGTPAYPEALTSLGVGAGNSLSLTYSPTNPYITAIGYQSCYSHTTAGAWGTYIGSWAGKNQTVGQHNTAVGTWSGYYGTGSYNVALGVYAMYGASGTDTKAYCTALGYQAGKAHAIGDYCTYVGSNAGPVNYNAVNNTMVGANAGLVCTSSDNTLVGYNTAPAVTTGLSNTCVGSNAGQLLGTTASYDTLIGHEAFARGVSRNGVTAVGYRAGYNFDSSGNAFFGYLAGGSGTVSTMSGSNQTYIGYSAGSYVGGNNNTAIGAFALFGNSVSPGTGSYNVAVGYQAGYRMEGGTHNTLVGRQAGEDIVGADYNTCYGAYAGSNLTTGEYNILLGISAGSFLSTGGHNIGIGDGTIYSNSFQADYVIAIGSSAGYTAGSYGIFIGEAAGAALSPSAPGLDNVAIGHRALYGNGNASTGANNVAIGHEAHWGIGGAASYNISIGTECRKWSQYGDYHITLGYQAAWDTSFANYTGHVLIGYQAGYKDQADGYEIAIGYQALGGTGTAHTGTGQNVCIGYRTGVAATTAYANTLLGYGCGTTLTTGYNNVILGHLCEGVAGSGSHDNILIGSSCTSALDHTVAIGESVALTVANTGQISPTAPAGPPTTTGYFWIGDGTTTYTLQAQTITALSDERIKKNIEDLTFGLDFINGLHPRLFDWRNPSSESSKRKTMGFIAQEMKRDAQEAGLEGSVYLDDNDKNWGVDYNQLVAPLVKAVQELSAQVVDLKKELAELKAQR